MLGLLEALFDTGREPKTVSEKPSLASLPSPIDYVSTGQAKQPAISAEKFTDSSEADSLPKSQNPERRFGQIHAKLFTLIGRKVRTPQGPGTLLQVFAERVTVLLDSERDRCSFFTPSQIDPVSND
jgi:hypothetical protein